jgi:hypothetical protein
VSSETRLRQWLAHWLRIYADRLDDRGAPKRMGSSFTYETGEGIRIRDDSKGCPLYYYGQDDLARAHAESDSAAAHAERSAIIDRWLERTEQRHSE